MAEAGSEMTSILRVCLLTAICGSLALAQAPLGDLARQQREAKTKKATRVITNEDLAAPAAAAPKTEETAEATGVDTPPETAQKPVPEKKQVKNHASENKEPAEADLAQLARQFRGRYSAQKALVDKLEREYHELQRSYDTQTTQYWLDAGSQLRNQEKWAEQRRKYEQELAAKELKLEAAKEKLDEIREQARRAGLSSAMFEE
jgi:hypothetical protein